MQPLASWPAARARGIRGVLTDIDDTLTTEGAVTADVLRGAGRAARGRRARDPHHRAGRWAGASRSHCSGRWTPSWRRTARSRCRDQRTAGVLRKLYQQDAAVRAANFARMQQVAQRIVREVPGATLARDSAGRETDIAIDHSEFAQLPQARDGTGGAPDAGRGHERHRELHPYQWLVRRPQQAVGRALDRARVAGARAGRRDRTAGSMSAIRPTTC